MSDSVKQLSSSGASGASSEHSQSAESTIGSGAQKNPSEEADGGAKDETVALQASKGTASNATPQEKVAATKPKVESPWTFTPIDSTFPTFHSKETQSLLEKWGLKQWMYAQSFQFAGPWTGQDVHTFLVDFFNSHDAQSALKVATKVSLVPFAGSAEKVTFSKLRATVTNMGFFDRLHDDIVRPSGSINRMMEEDFDDVTVSDHLREMLVNEDSENAYVFSDEEKEEFLFHLLKLLAVGGTMMQYEDDVEPYLAAAKGIYKDFLTVFRNMGTGRVEIANQVFRIHEIAGTASLFPTKSDHNMCLVSVDPIKKAVSILYSARVPYW